MCLWLKHNIFYVSLAIHRSSGYTDDLLYAAAMLYKATGDEAFLVDAENKYQEFGFDYATSWAFDWSDKLMGAKVGHIQLSSTCSYGSADM